MGAGLPAEWLADHQQALARVTVDEVQAAARRYLASTDLTAVVVGDAERVASSLELLGPLEVAPAEGEPAT
jgi:predicted Zn-dependent peptidase